MTLNKKKMLFAHFLFNFFPHSFTTPLFSFFSLFAMLPFLLVILFLYDDKNSFPHLGWNEPSRGAPYWHQSQWRTREGGDGGPLVMGEGEGRRGKECGGEREWVSECVSEWVSERASEQVSEWVKEGGREKIRERETEGVGKGRITIRAYWEDTFPIAVKKNYALQAPPRKLENNTSSPATNIEKQGLLVVSRYRHRAPASAGTRALLLQSGVGARDALEGNGI